MIEQMPVFLRPEWLWLAPVLLGLLWWQRRQPQHLGHWQKILPATFQSALLTHSKKRLKPAYKLWLAAAWLLAIIALAGPSWHQYQQPARQSYTPLVIMLELTPQMLAQDGRPTRLAQAKHKIFDLLASRQGAPTAVVVFAGSAHTLVPLSDDQATLQHLLDALDPSIMPLSGHRADLALRHALALLEQGAQGRGELLLITSQLPDASLTALKQQAASLTRPLRILGVGSVAGAPLVDSQGGFLRDPQGAIMVAKLERAKLQRFAQDNGFFYQSISVDDRDLSRLQLQNPVSDSANVSELPTLRWLDQGYWLMLPLLLLSALAARRGVLLGVALMLVLPEPSTAMSWQDLWLRADQQGAKALREQRPIEAAEHFEDPLWRGYALFEAGAFTAAAEQFARSDSALAHYNRGTALAAADKLQAALDAFDQALALDPELKAAAHNRERVEEALRTQQTLANPLLPTPTPSHQSSNITDQEASESASVGGASSAENLSPAQEQPLRNEEDEQALDQWLRQVPDHPGELLKRKFLLELPEDTHP